MSINLFAYTAPPGEYQFYPPYLSVNKEHNGNTSISVRSPELPDGRCGETARIELSPEQLAALKRSL